MDKIFYRPVIGFLVALIIGIVLGYKFFGHSLLILPLIICLIVIIAFWIALRKNGSIPHFLLFTCLGYISIQPWIAPDFPANHITRFMDSQPITIVGTIISQPEKSESQSRFFFETEKLLEKDKSFVVEGNIRVTISGKNPDLHKGDQISFQCLIKSFRNFSNPGAFDYKRYMAFQDIWGSLWVKAEDIRILKTNDKSNFFDCISLFRNNIGDLIEKTNKPGSASILKALVIGDQSGIDKDLRVAFARTGLSHLLSVSGLHISIVASLSFLLFRRLLSFLPFLLHQGLVKKAAAAISILPVLIYGLLSGMEPATQRSVAMVGIFLMTFLFERESDILNTLALAAFIILIVSPTSLFLVSFQLSFIAVLSIIIGMSLIPIKTTPDDPILFKYLNRFLLFLAVSFFATLGTLPLVMYYFNIISLIGLFANCIGIPVIGFVVVSLGLFSVFLYPVSIHAAFFGFQVCVSILDYSIKIIMFLSGLDFAALKTIAPGMLEITCFYVLLAGILHFRKSNAAKIIVLASALVLAADISYWINRRFFARDLILTAMDVGQGTATLIELPKGYTMLVDGGGFSDNSAFDIGEYVVAPYLLRNKIKTLDAVVLSHPNSDHMNGLIYIAKNFNVKSFWTNGENAQTLGYKSLMAAISDKNINMPEFKTIARAQTINKVKIQILSPPENFLDEKIKAGLKDTNDDSIVLRLSFGSNSFLLPGDITEQGEFPLAASERENLVSTVLFSPHHGSKTSSSASFLNKVSPKIVIISAGWKNRFNFPHPSIMERYKELGCDVYRTDLNGAVRIKTDGERLEINKTK